MVLDHYGSSSSLSLWVLQAPVSQQKGIGTKPHPSSIDSENQTQIASNNCGISGLRFSVESGRIKHFHKPLSRIRLSEVSLVAPGYAPPLAQNEDARFYCSHFVGGSMETQPDTRLLR